MVAIATLYWKWMTIALLLAVVVAVWATDRYLTSRYATILPPHGKTVLITGCDTGLNRQAPVELTSMASFQLLADVMLFGTVRVTKALLPVVRQAKGRVITMSSDRGMLSPANSAAYCISKHGVETFSDVLRAEMYDFGVSVSVIQPGHFGGATAIINDKAVLGQVKPVLPDRLVDWVQRIVMGNK
nr:hypothetical protein BaRGS_000036 [Batillaria attramentaria]